MNYAALASTYTPRSRKRRYIIGQGWIDMIAPIFSATGEMVQKGAQYKQQQDAAQAAEKSSREALDAVIIADNTATSANAVALIAEEAKSPSVAADRMAAEQASQAQDAAAAGLSPENQKKRADAAKAALAKAISAYQAASGGKDAAKTKTAELRVKAAQATYAKTQNQMMVSKGSGMADMSLTPPKESWLTRRVLGPIPGWGVLAGGAVATGGLAALITYLVRR